MIKDKSTSCLRGSNLHIREEGTLLSINYVNLATAKSVKRANERRG